MGLLGLTGGPLGEKITMKITLKKTQRGSIALFLPPLLRPSLLVQGP